MSFSRTMLCTVVLSASAVGCTDSGLTSPAPAETSIDWADPPSLALRAPTISRDDLSNHEVVGTLGDAPDAAAIIDKDGHSYVRPIQQIFNANTRVYFKPGYAGALGQHEYIGNVGGIETNAYVTYQSQDLGSQLSLRDQYTPFLADFGRVKTIYTEARVYTEHTCGLTVRGTSYHRAQWQFFTGTGSPMWGSARRTSQSSPAANGACTSGGTRQRTGTESRGGGLVCHYLITYEIATGVIVDVERLRCVANEGPKI